MTPSADARDGRDADRDRLRPCYGLNLGTVGFLMNRSNGKRTIAERVARALRLLADHLDEQGAI